ncbi:MAG TPA: T9SS type A sorting domain-containing protein, partial [Chitinophagales bacterium]|nr:T9SS type A sorting domain-containing protein [Chitinophagales bacterium]
ILGYKKETGVSTRHALVYTMDRHLNPTSAYVDSNLYTTAIRDGFFDGGVVGFGYRSSPSQSALVSKQSGGNVTAYSFGSGLFQSGFRVNNHYFAAGYTGSSTQDVNPFLEPQDLFVCKIDPAGNLIRRDVYHMPDQQWMNRAAISPDSTKILLSGMTAYADSPGWDSTRALFILVDTGGQEIWRKEITFGIWDDITDVAATSDGFYFTASTSCCQPVAYYSIIGELDMSGNIQWSKRLGYDESIVAMPYDSRWFGGDAVSINVLQNSDLLLTGKWQNKATPTLKDDGFVARFTSDGDSLWRYDYNSTRYDWFTEAVEDRLGYIYACGYTNPSSTSFFGNGELLVVKLDAYGCPIDTCIMPEPVVPEPSPVNAVAFPNPFSNILQLGYYNGKDENIGFEVYDAVGRKVIATTVSASASPTSIDTHKWANGFYIAVLRLNGLVERIRLVKQ